MVSRVSLSLFLSLSSLGYYKYSPLSFLTPSFAQAHPPTSPAWGSKAESTMHPHPHPHPRPVAVAVPVPVLVAVV